MAETGRLSAAPTRGIAGRPGAVAARRCIIVVVLVIWEAVAASGLLYRDVVPSLVAIAAELAKLLSKPELLLESRGDRGRGRHRAVHRRAVRHGRGTGAWRQPIARQGVRTLPVLSRADAEDHVLPDHDHVVRRRPRVEGRDGRDLLLLPDRAVGGRRHAPDRSGADPRRQELPRQYVADGNEDLSAGHAPSDHQRRAARPRRRDHRDACWPRPSCRTAASAS